MPYRVGKFSSREGPKDSRTFQDHFCFDFIFMLNPSKIYYHDRVMMGELGEPNALPGGQILLKGRSKRLKNFPGSLLF